MASVEKRQNAKGATFYIVKWRTPDGKHRTKGGFKTRRAADTYATRTEAAKLRGTDHDPKAGNITFREQAAQWLASRHDLKPTTRGGHEYALAPVARRAKSSRALSIDAVFGGYPLNKITREHVSKWVNNLTAAGKRPSTVRHEYFRVRQILAQAVADGRLPSNPADYVKLPTEHSAQDGTPGVVDDPSQFLTALQVQSLINATPWPYNVLVHVAAWAGLRAAELGGLTVGDVNLPPNKPGQLQVQRSARPVGNTIVYLAPKTKGSRRTVPLTPATTNLLAGYLAEHPNADDPSAPLFPNMCLAPAKPTGVKAAANATTAKAKADRQATALGNLTVDEAGARLVLDWASPLRHATFYKAVYRPAVLRANRAATASKHPAAALPPDLKFHACRHSYASLCVAARIPAFDISRFMGHSKPTTTLGIYAHLFEDDHAGSMAALGALATARQPSYGKVIPLHG
jgi:integrase